MPYQQTTLAELLTSLKAGWDSAPFWTDAEAKRYLNHGLRLWNLLTGMWKRKVVLTTTAGAHYLTLPGSLVYGMQLTWGPTSEALQISALYDFDMGRPRWEEETTASGGDVPGAPQLWAPSGLTEIAIWPADALGGRQILADGVAATPTLAAPGDFVDMGAQDATAVVRLALHIACFKRGIAATKTTEAYLREFVQAAAAQNDRLKKSAHFRKYLGLDLEKGLRPMMRLRADASGGSGASGGGQG